MRDEFYSKVLEYLHRELDEVFSDDGLQMWNDAMKDLPPYCYLSIVYNTRKCVFELCLIDRVHHHIKFHPLWRYSSDGSSKCLNFDLPEVKEFKENRQET